MKKINYYLLSLVIIGMSILSCKTKSKEESNKTVATDVWEIDFLDNFDTFNPENWQDQRIWVNNEKQSYVPDGKFGTREVSDGSLKIKVVKVDEKRSSDNYDKNGKQQKIDLIIEGKSITVFKLAHFYSQSTYIHISQICSRIQKALYFDILVVQKKKAWEWT